MLKCSWRQLLADSCRPAAIAASSPAAAPPRPTPRPLHSDFSCYSLLRHWLPGKAPPPGAADQPRSLWQALADAGSAIVCGGLAGMVRERDSLGACWFTPYSVG